MRTFLYAFALCSLLVLTAGCGLTGEDGTFDGAHYQHATARSSQMVGVISGGQTYWPWSKVRINGCVNHMEQVFDVVPSGNPHREFGVNGVYEANIDKYLDKTRYSTSQDDTGDGYVSGWDTSLIGIGFFPITPDCTGALFVDSIRFSNPWPGGGGFSKALTDNVVFNSVASARSTGDFNNSGLDRLSLEERVMVLNSIDTTNDLVDVDGQTMIELNLTEIAVNGETFRPEGVGLLMSDTFDMGTYNMDAPGIKPFYSWLAGRFQASLDAGTDADVSLLINDNVTLTSVDYLNWLAANNGATTGITQGFVDNLRNIAGSDITGTDNNSRSGRR